MNSFLSAALQQRILPAISFDRPEHVLPVTNCLLEGGLRIMEIPFRSSITEAAIKLIRHTFPEMLVGAGTLLTPEQVQCAKDCGAQFGLSPGFNADVLKSAHQVQLPFIPGVMTPSEIEHAFAAGCSILKLFPADQVGGVAFLKAIEGPYHHLDLRFIPMGGVNEHNMHAYLQLSNVIAVGGSWLATKALLAQGNFSQISGNIKAALAQINAPQPEEKL